MYESHVPIIAAAMRADEAVFRRGVSFVLLSIRSQVVTLPVQMADVDENGVTSKYLLASKRDGYHYLLASSDLWPALCGATDTKEAMTILLEMPGLGVVKSAFVLQMLGFDTACLDTRNLKREGYGEREWRHDGHNKGAKGYRRVIDRYLSVTQGRAKELWNAWCEEVASVYGYTPEHISKLHLECIVPRTMRSLPTQPCPLLGQPEDMPF